MLRAVSHSLALFLPALAPSWRFFEEIKPSPRIEIAVLRGERAEARRWSEFRPKPETVSIGALIVRLVFNPHRNENLYLLTACEKLLLEESQAARRTILARIRSDLSGVAASEAQNPERSWVVFRIAALRREGGALVKEVAYESAPEPLVDETRRELSRVEQALEGGGGLRAERGGGLPFGN